MLKVRLLCSLIIAVHLPIYTQEFHLNDRYEYTVYSQKNHFDGTTKTHYTEILTIDSVSRDNEIQYCFYTRTNIRKKIVEIDGDANDSAATDCNDTISRKSGVYILGTDKFCSIEEDTVFVAGRSVLSDTFHFIDPCSFVNELTDCFTTEPDRAIVLSSDSNVTICDQNTVVLQGSSYSGDVGNGDNSLSIKISPVFGIVRFRMADLSPHGLSSKIWDKCLYKVNGQLKSNKPAKSFARSDYYGNSQYYNLSGREIKPDRRTGRGVYLLYGNIKCTKILIDLNKSPRF